MLTPERQAEVYHPDTGWEIVECKVTLRIPMSIDRKYGTQENQELITEILDEAAFDIVITEFEEVS